jgi:MinD-like ATPase involved in chromosome partitioning or flagellar assembly
VTVVAFSSVKGAPGMTTLACLVGAAWPEGRKVMVVECDPSGGDLAARFRLSSRIGWPSLISAARRSDPDTLIESHLQQLPGGLDVLIGTTGRESSETDVNMAAVLAAASSSSEETWDVLVDLGRLLPCDSSAANWLNVSDVVVIGLRGDAASVMQLRERSAAMLSQWNDRLALVIMRSQWHSSAEIEEFTGIPVIGETPSDAQAAAVAAGERFGERRLSRSLLCSSATRLATRLAAAPHSTTGPQVVAEAIDIQPDHASRHRRVGAHHMVNELRVLRRQFWTWASSSSSTSSNKALPDVSHEEALN